MFKKVIKILAVLFLLFLVILGGVGYWYFKKYDTPDYEHRGFFPLPKLKPIWERKVKSQQILKIGIITDTHIRAKRVNRKNELDNAPRVLKEVDVIPFQDFNYQMNLFKPDFVIHLGDIIEGTGDEDFVGLASLKLAKEEMEKAGFPIYWVLGNHELRSITKDQFKQFFNFESLNRYFDNGDYRFVTLDTNYYADGRASMPLHSSNDGFLPEETLNWLEPILQTEKQVFLLLHHPLDGRVDGEFSIKNAEKLQSLLEKYNVKAVFNGHIETKYFKEKNGVQYFSLVGTKKNLIYEDAFYELTIEKVEPKVKMFYTKTGMGEKVEVDFKQN